jgi:hypothetical protein
MNMQDMFISGDNEVQPNLESFQIAIDAWTKASNELNATTRVPDKSLIGCQLFTFRIRTILPSRMYHALNRLIM